MSEEESKNQPSSKSLLLKIVGGLVISSVLAAMASSSFLNQSGKAYQSRARRNITSINQAQTSYFLSNSSFASNVDALKKYGVLDDPSLEEASQQNGIYSYIIYGSSISNFSQQAAIPQRAGLKSYTSINQVGKNTDGNTINLSAVCESLDATQSVPQVQPGDGGCPSGFRLLDR